VVTQNKTYVFYHNPSSFNRWNGFFLLRIDPLWVLNRFSEFSCMVSGVQTCRITQVSTCFWGEFLYLKKSSNGGKAMKVLVPIDGSIASNETLDWLPQFLDKSSAGIMLLYVVDDRLASEIQAMESGKVQRLLDEARQTVSQHGFGMVDTDYVIGYPPEKIREYADRKDVLMIIMGARGRSCVNQLLMGSVSSEVFKTAKQQVLVLNNTHRPSLTMPLGPPPLKRNP
jgi:nucleotide-binding universal stress UspA family protein